MFKKLALIAFCVLLVTPSWADFGGLIKQSSTEQNLTVILTDVNGNGINGVTPTVTLAKAGATYVAPSGNVSQVADLVDSTLSVTNGSATVTDTGAVFTSALIGAYVSIVSGTTSTYTVTAVASTTSLTLSATFTGTTASSITGTFYYSGTYKVTANAADTNTLGDLVVKAYYSGYPIAYTRYNIVAPDLQSATNFGLSALPTASPAASGGLPTLGTGSGQINPDGTGAVPQAMGQALPTSPASGTVGLALASLGYQVTRGPLTCQAGSTSSTIVLDASASTTNGLYVGHFIKIVGGTGSGQFATITAYVGSTQTATIIRPGVGTWTTTPDSTSVYIMWGEPLPTLAPSQTFATTGAVGSITAAVQIGSYASNEDPATLVLGATASTWNTSGTIGAKINSGGGGSDPWATALPGSYTSGEAGYILGTYLTAAPPTSSTIASSVWSDALPGAFTSGQAGYLVGNNLTVATSSLATSSALSTLQSTANTINTNTASIPTASANATAVWGAGTRTLTGTPAVNVSQWNGTNVVAPATAGVPEVDVKTINAVSTSAVTTVKAVQGLTTADTVTTATNVTNAVTVTGTPAVNVTEIAGQTASAAAGVTFPSSIGTSNYAGTDTSGTTTLLTRLTQAILFDPSGYIKGDVYAYNTSLDPATQVLGATASSWNTAGTIGNKINSAASAGDPWTTSLPGSYTAGQAGYIVGNNLNVAASTLATSSAVSALQSTANTINTNTSAIPSASANATAVWAAGSRTLTAFGFNVTVGGYGSDEDPGYLVGTRVVDGGITFDGTLAMLIANLAGIGTNSFTSPHLTTTYKRQDGTTTAFTNTTTYAAGVTPPVSSRSSSIGTLPN